MFGKIDGFCVIQKNIVRYFMDNSFKKQLKWLINGCWSYHTKFLEVISARLVCIVD